MPGAEHHRYSTRPQRIRQRKRQPVRQLHVEQRQIHLRASQEPAAGFRRGNRPDDHMSEMREQLPTDSRLQRVILSQQDTQSVRHDPYSR